jgi:hypothetical protein
MGGMKLDGAGAQKMKTLEEAQLTISRMNAMIERAAIEAKANKPIGPLPLQIKRVAVPMQGQLKGQFGMIADLIAVYILNITRGGGGDQAKIRVMREGLAQIKQAMDFAVSKVKSDHMVEIELAPD